MPGAWYLFLQSRWPLVVRLCPLPPHHQRRCHRSLCGHGALGPLAGPARCVRPAPATHGAGGANPDPSGPSGCCRCGAAPCAGSCPFCAPGCCQRWLGHSSPEGEWVLGRLLCTPSLSSFFPLPSEVHGPLPCATCYAMPLVNAVFTSVKQFPCPHTHTDNWCDHLTLF